MEKTECLSYRFKANKIRKWNRFPASDNHRSDSLKRFQAIKLIARIVVTDNNSISTVIVAPDAFRSWQQRRSVAVAPSMSLLCLFKWEQCSQNQELCSGLRKLAGNLNVAKTNFHIFLHSVSQSVCRHFFIISGYAQFVSPRGEHFVKWRQSDLYASSLTTSPTQMREWKWREKYEIL